MVKQKDRFTLQRIAAFWLNPGYSSEEDQRWLVNLLLDLKEPDLDKVVYTSSKRHPDILKRLEKESGSDIVKLTAMLRTSPNASTAEHLMEIYQHHPQDLIEMPWETIKDLPDHDAYDVINVERVKRVPNSFVIEYFAPNVHPPETIRKMTTLFIKHAEAKDFLELMNCTFIPWQNIPLDISQQALNKVVNLFEMGKITDTHPVMNFFEKMMEISSGKGVVMPQIRPETLNRLKTIFEDEMASHHAKRFSSHGALMLHWIIKSQVSIDEKVIREMLSILPENDLNKKFSQKILDFFSLKCRSKYDSLIQ